MEKKIEIEIDQYNKLVKLFQKVNVPDFDKKKIRRLQFLVKNKMPKEKVKIYGIINMYQKTYDTYLKVYLENLYHFLEDDKDYNITLYQ